MVSGWVLNLFCIYLCFLGAQNDASGRRPLREKIGSLGEKKNHTPGVTVFQAFSKRICNGTSHLIDLLVMWSTWLMFLGWQLGVMWVAVEYDCEVKPTIKQPNSLPWNSWWSKTLRKQKQCRLSGSKPWKINSRLWLRLPVVYYNPHNPPTKTLYITKKTQNNQGIPSFHFTFIWVLLGLLEWWQGKHDKGTGERTPADHLKNKCTVESPNATMFLWLGLGGSFHYPKLGFLWFLTVDMTGRKPGSCRVFTLHPRIFGLPLPKV